MKRILRPSRLRATWLVGERPHVAQVCARRPAHSFSRSSVHRGLDSTSPRSPCIVLGSTFARFSLQLGNWYLFRNFSTSSWISTTTDRRKLVSHGTQTRCTRFRLNVFGLSVALRVGWRYCCLSPRERSVHASEEKQWTKNGKSKVQKSIRHGESWLAAQSALFRP